MHRFQYQLQDLFCLVFVDLGRVIWFWIWISNIPQYYDLCLHCPFVFIPASFWYLYWPHLVHWSSHWHISFYLLWKIDQKKNLLWKIINKIYLLYWLLYFCTSPSVLALITSNSIIRWMQVHLPIFRCSSPHIKGSIWFQIA